MLVVASRRLSTSVPPAIRFLFLLLYRRKCILKRMYFLTCRVTQKNGHHQKSNNFQNFSPPAKRFLFLHFTCFIVENVFSHLCISKHIFIVKSIFTD